MVSNPRSGFRLNVLNPRGRDPEQHFADVANSDSSAHAPVNFHAYAACTGGSFYRETKKAIAAGSPVLLLLRGDFRASERALAQLKEAGVPVAVSLKETGLHQIAEQMNDRTRLGRFLRMVREADCCIAPTPEAAEVYRLIRGQDSVAFIPTPYPLHDPQWNFSRVFEERHGILVGTREWDIPSRNHCAALVAARRISEATGEVVSVFEDSGRAHPRLLAEIGFPAGKLRVLTERSYADYLRVMSEHKIVFQLDTSFVPGQVAGDALLCRMPCVGGHGTIERIAFPELYGAGRSIAELVEVARRLLLEPAGYLSAIGGAQERATEFLSFRGVAQQLEQFVAAEAR